MRARRAARCRIAADQVEFTVDDIACQSVAGEFHVGQQLPAVVGRVVCLHRAKGSLPWAGSALFTAGDIDFAFVRAPRHRAARVGHRRFQRTPLIGRGIVFFDNADVGGSRNECRTDSSAQVVNLVVDHANGAMITRRRHRLARLPGVACRVVNLVGRQRAMRTRRVQHRFFGTRMRPRAADDVNLALMHRSSRRATFGGQRRQRLPGIGARIVFKNIVHRLPARRTGVGILETADHINLAVDFRQRNMMRGHGHIFLLGPRVFCGVVFVHQALRLPARRETAEHIKFAARAYAVQLLRGFRKWRGARQLLRRSESRRQHD